MKAPITNKLSGHSFLGLATVACASGVVLSLAGAAGIGGAMIFLAVILLAIAALRFGFLTIW